ncbi:CBL-interacting protein kinase 32 [Diplonema papillatum]|nr:CBL-interacting protein kinase 32 [Diplonema papillatum]
MPKKIGKYELGKTLGTGTFSKVKQGFDTENGGEFAIKIIDKEKLAKEHMEEQLKREIAVMKLLRHENIVQLKEVLQTQKHIYLILELVPGGELFDRIVDAKRFDEPTARRYFQQLVMGVYYCHQQGIAHRDLKPENLLVDGEGLLKISDFGLSNLQRGGAGGGGTLLQTVCGTPNYVAPEVLKEKGYNGITADIWSCGVILFVMLAGYLPFDDSNMNKLFNKIERGEYRMARHFSEPVRNLISRMLVIEPEKRATLDGIVADAWFQVGFDQSQMDKYKGKKVSVSQKEVQGAVRSVEDPDGKDAAPTPKSDQAGDGPEGLDAFTLITRLASSSLAPFTGPLSTAERKKACRLCVSTDPHRAIKSLVDVLTELKGNPKRKEGAIELKGFANASKGLITYVANAVPLVSSELTLVEFRRGRGDVNDFQGFFDNVRAKLGPLVISGKPETDQVRV